MSRHSRQQHAERDESEIAVNDARSRFVFEMETRNCTRRAFRLVFSQQIQRSPGGQSRRVSEQFTHRDHRLVCAIELRQVMRHRTVERQLTKLDASRAEQTGDEWFG